MYYNGRWDVETNGWPSELDKTEGWGDPCLLADDGAFSNYMVPLGGRLNGGWNNAMFNADGNGTAIWANNPDWYLKTINEVNLVGVANSPILTMFLPAVGYRRGDGGATLMGTMMGFPPDGYTSAWYWSGTSEGLNDVEGWGSLLTITTNPYSPGNIGRTFNSPMRRGSAVPIRCVKNNDTPKARKGVYAPPGVLGVGAETGNLTLKGSNTYKGTAVAHNSEFGPLANEKVYMAYFKYGSAVAISGGEINGETFGPNDIIWRPSGYTKQIVSYGDIEYDDTIDDGKTPTASNPNKGWDDPCALADAGTSVEEWTIPTGGGNDGWNEMWKGTGVGANAGLDWSLAGAAWYNVAGIQGALKDNWKAFIPAAGIRDENGVMNYDGNGHYWSNTAARSLMIASGGAINNDGNIRDRAMPIRCAIKTEPPIIIPPPDLTLSAASILAPPGILGYTLKGELTLRGSRGYKHTPVATGADGVSTTEFGPIHDEQVFIAYFKWGSAIAISAATHPGESNPNAFIPDEDIVWVPKGYKGINTSEEDAREHAWNTVTSWADIRSNSGSGSNGWPVNETEGLGDPCKFIEDHENPGTYPYRLPNGGNGQNSTVNGWHNGYAGTSVNTGVIYSNPHLNWVMAAENTGVTSPKLVYDGLGINDWGIPMPEGMRVRNWDMFLPMSGRRTATGDIEYQNSDGYFWSSTPNGAITGFGLRICNNNYGGLITDPTNSNLGFAYPCLGENQTTPRIQSSYHNAYAIRCVK